MHTLLYERFHGRHRAWQLAKACRSTWLAGRRLRNRESPRARRRGAEESRRWWKWASPCDLVIGLGGPTRRYALFPSVALSSQADASALFPGRSLAYAQHRGMPEARFHPDSYLLPCSGRRTATSEHPCPEPRWRWHALPSIGDASQGRHLAMGPASRDDGEQ